MTIAEAFRHCREHGLRSACPRSSSMTGRHVHAQNHSQRHPCLPSPPPRRDIKQVLLAAQFLDMHRHATALRKVLEEVGDNLFRRIFRRRVERMGSPQNSHG